MASKAEAIAEPVPAAPSPSAARVRRCRERRRHGAVVVALVLRPKITDALSHLGWLAAADRGDKDAVTDAFIALAVEALERGIRPRRG